MKRLMMKRRRQGWDSLSEEQKRGFGVVAVVQAGLLLFALQDWIRRPGDSMRGPKRLWLPLLFVNFVGPITYLAWGRSGGGSDWDD